jgi:hypothetical protein
MPNLSVALVVSCISICLLTLMPGGAQAGAMQCGKTLIHDWYMDGRIQGQYPVSCYHAALADVPADEVIYGTMRTDLSQALSSGVDRVKNEGVTARPLTLLPAPTTRLAASPVTTTSQKSYSARSLAALAFLLALLVVWCVVRWRNRGVTQK